LADAAHTLVECSRGYRYAPRLSFHVSAAFTRKPACHLIGDGIIGVVAIGFVLPKRVGA
jgi:hypothetical protein